MLESLKRDVKNEYMGISDYFSGAFTFWKYFLKKEKKWVLALFVIFFIKIFTNKFVEIKYEDSVILEILDYLLMCCLSATNWVLYKKIIFKLTDREEIDIFKTYLKSIPVVAVISTPIYFIASILLHIAEGKYNSFVRIIGILIIIFLIVFVIVSIVFIYFIQVYMTKEMTLKEKISYTYKLSNGNRWICVICGVIEVFFYYLIKLAINFIIMIILHLIFNDINYFYRKEILDIAGSTLRTIFSISLVCIIYVNVENKFKKRIAEEEQQEQE